MKCQDQHWKVSYIGIGSNLNNPIHQVNEAILSIQKIPKTCFIVTSSLYESSPMGPSNQPNYINAVVAILTLLEPHDLLDELQRIEIQQKRIRSTEKWGPRTIDIDLLIFSNEVINDESLILPHPGIQHRDFVLTPLVEIAPDLVVKGPENVVDLLNKIHESKINIKIID
tara:strand:+ start:179 stop:688 length:510 start_codon:yes stop_codon:yes gene_type:complete